MYGKTNYPRPLTELEKSWLEWILPIDRRGYREYRELLSKLVVLGEGRRGKGNVVLGFSGDVPDMSSPLPPVFAYGVIETNFGAISITVRENAGDQIDVEIISHRTDEVPEVFEESRRWTYSTWSPGSVCPQCQKPVREILMHSEQNKHFVLAVCAGDKRLWVYDAETQVNHLIPVTNFYNELMLHKNIRDSKIALDSKRLFVDLAKYTDPELTYAFLTYNKLKSKVEVRGILTADRREKKSFVRRLQSLIPKKK